MPAALFVRELSASRAAHIRAHETAEKIGQFYILAHHPYPIAPRAARDQSDDVVVPDFAKLTKRSPSP